MKTQKNKIWSALNYLIAGLFVVNIFIFLYIEMPEANIISIIFITAITIAIIIGIGKGLADRKKIEIKEKTQQICEEAYAKEAEDWDEKEKMINEEFQVKYEKKLEEEKNKYQQKITDLKSEQLFQMEQYKQKIRKEEVKGLQFREQKM